MRGENVGSAYVKIYADGSGMDDDVRDSLDELNEAYGEAGQKHAEEYNKARDKELARKPTQKALRETLTRDAQRTRRLVRQLGGSYGEQMRRGLVAEFGKDLGRQMWEMMSKDILRSGDFDAVFEKIKDEDGKTTSWRVRNLAAYHAKALDMNRKALEQQAAEARRIAEKEAAERARIDAQERREQAQRAQQLNGLLINLANDRIRRQKAARREEVADWDRAFQEQIQSSNRAIAATREREREFRDSFDRMLRAVERLRHGVANADEGIDDSLRHTIGHVRELRREMERLDFDRVEIRRFTENFDAADRTLIRINPRFRQFNGALDRMVPRIGRAFGRGARNDLVNFIGVMVQGMTAMAFSIPKGVEALQGVIAVSRAAGQAGEAVGIFQKLGAAASGVASRFAAAGPAIAAFAIAIPIVITVVGAVVSAISILIGILAALASTIYFAAIAALGALAGAIVPVVAAVGVLAGAIMSMSDAQKAALKTAIKPFVEGMKEMGRSAADIIFGGRQFETTIRRMTNALTSSNMRGLVDNIARAIGNVGEGWAAAIDSPNFQRFVRVMSESLPRQIESLGRTMSNTFSALGGTIIALQPTVDRFLGWLERITAEWAAWAQSPRGQREMLDFFDRAVESAKSLWGFVKELSGLIQDVFTAGQSTGDSLFDDMADAIGRFRAYIAEGGLQRWFEDVRKYAGDFGRVIQGLGRLLDALDSPGFRAFAGYLLNFFTKAADAVTALVGPIATLGDSFARLREGAKAIFEGDWEGFASNLLAGIALGLQGLKDIFTAPFRAALAAIKALFGIRSPSTVFMQMGIDIIAGLLLGLASLAGQVIAFFGKLAVDALTALGSGLANAGSTLLSIFNPANVVALGARALEIGRDIAGKVGEGITVAKDRVVSGAKTLGDAAVTGFQRAREGAGRLRDELANRLSTGADRARDRGVNMAGRFSGTVRAGFDTARAGADRLRDTVASRLTGALDRGRSAGDRVAGIFRGAVVTGLNAARGAFGAVADVVSRLIGSLGSVIATARRAASALSNIKMPSLGGLGGLVQRAFASGGLVYGPTRALVGEAGPEAVVPLNRPLSQVDPAVRELSAIAQGKTNSKGLGSTGKSLTIGELRVVTPTKDPRAVVHEVVDELVELL